MPPNASENIAALMARAERHLRASRGRLRRVASSEADLAVRVGCSVAALLDDQVTEVLKNDHDHKRWFVERISGFDHGLDRLVLMLVVGTHVSNQCMARFPGNDRAAKLEAVLELHAHSTLVTNEIVDMLRGGWPAAAQARWRTLHEIEVIALFLAKAPNVVSKRYLASWETDMDRLVRKRELRLPAGRDSRALRDEIRSRADAAVALHGPELAKPYGWANRSLRKKRVHFADLERRVAPRRPAYASASNRVHAGRVGALYSLVETPDHFLTGRRAEGLADVGLQTIWSANSAAGALLATARTMAPDDEFLIWDEAQTQIAAEADIELRRAEMMRLIRAGRNDEATWYQPSPAAGWIHFKREAVTPRRDVNPEYDLLKDVHSESEA